MDSLKNFAFSTVATAPSPAASGTSLTVAAGHGTRFPTAPFNLVVSPAAGPSSPDDLEIIRVTDVTDDVLTIQREQEGTAARTILVGDAVTLSVTKKTLEDLWVNPSFATGYTQGGAHVVSRTTLAALEVDVSKPHSIKAVASNLELTPSNATPTAGHKFRLTLVADSTARTITIWECYSKNRGSTITSVVVPADGELDLFFDYTGARWDVFGDPVATTGTGSFVQQNAPTLSGAVQLDENASIALDPAGSADGKFSGISISGTAGATLAFGDLCYLNNDDSRWELADANLSDGYDKLLGMCVLAAASDGDPTRLLLFGQIRADAKFPTLTVGAPAYMSETAGAVVVTAPSTSGAAVRVVGHALTADEMLFNPSSTTVVLS